MTRPLKPPRGIFISSSVIFDNQLTPATRDTLIQLLALGWSSRTHTTPLLSMPLLSEMTGKAINTLYGHIAVLRDEHAALRLQSAGNGTFTITFADWVYPPNSLHWGSPHEANGREAHAFGFPETPDHNEDEERAEIKLALDVPLSDQTAASVPLHPKHKPARRKAAPPHTRERQLTRLSPQLCQELQDAGVFPGLLVEIDGSDYSENELRALLAWADADSAGHPAGLFVWRLRCGAHPPRVYLAPPCPRCGKRGKHTPSCPQQYIEGPFKDLVQH